MFFAYVKIFVSKLIGDVPSNGSKFSAILNDGVEEAESEEKFFVFDWF